LKSKRINIRSNFFSQHTVKHWNSLPEHVVSASSVNCFKNRLDSCRVGHLKATAYAGFTLEMREPCMQVACRMHAACRILHTVVCGLHTDIIRATCKLHNWKNTICILKMRWTWSLHSGCSILQQGVDSLNWHVNSRHHFLGVIFCF